MKSDASPGAIVVEAVYTQTGLDGLDAQAVTRRLVYLRKRGRLPRLRRAYRGRNLGPM
jgi:hypothetical protein